LGHARPDQHIVGEAPGVEERDLDAAAARAAKAATSAATAAETATTRAAPAAAGAGARTATAATPARALSAAAEPREPACGPGRRRERLLEVEAPAQLAPRRAGEVDRPRVDLQQAAVGVAHAAA